MCFTECEPTGPGVAEPAHKGEEILLDQFGKRLIVREIVRVECVWEDVAVGRQMDAGTPLVSENVDTLPHRELLYGNGSLGPEEGAYTL